MAALAALHAQQPYWIWLAAASFFVAARIAAGRREVMWPAVACVGVALVEGVGLRLGPVGEVGVFLALLAAIGGVILARRSKGGPRARGEPQPKREGRAKAPPQVASTGGHELSGRLVGRIARSSGAFANGVGRVWIDGAEWAAELDGADGLAAAQPVRIVKVIGGIRLQVHPLDAG